jgi:membrane protein YqaA with SNARE-associated domain
MIGVLATSLGVGFVSAFFPGLPAEPYLLGAVATTSVSPALLALATAVGQSFGKLAMLLAVRGTLRAPALHRWIANKRAQMELKAALTAGRAPENPGWLRRARTRTAKLAQLDRTSVTVPILLLSAVVGIPPLIIMTFTTAAGKMRAWVFLVTCLTGRTVRMMMIAFAPGLIMG